MAPQAIDPIAAKFGGTAVAPAEPAIDPTAKKYGGTVDPIAAKWGGTPDGTRPPPIQVDRGFTSGVSVTGPADSFGPTIGAPPAAAAPAPVRLGSAKTGGGATATPNFMDVPTEGVTQIARGAGALLSHPAVLPTEPHVIAASAPGKDEATYNALSDLLEGAGKAASPLAVAGAIIDLPGTVLTLGLSYLTASAAGGAARLAQASPAVQRFVTALAGSATALGLGSRQIGQLKTKAADVLAKQAADARAVVAQAQAHDAAYDAANPPPPEEPIPVGRGATDAAAAAKPKLEAVNDVLPPSPEPGAPPPAPPALDIDAAIRDLATAEPSSPQAMTAMVALQRAGLDLPTITARVQQARATPPAAVPAPSERPRMVNGPYVDPTAAKFGGEPVAPPVATAAAPAAAADPIAETFGGVPEEPAALSTQTEQALPPAQMNAADIKAEIASHDERPVAAERLTALQQELGVRDLSRGLDRAERMLERAEKRGTIEDEAGNRLNDELDAIDRASGESVPELEALQARLDAVVAELQGRTPPAPKPVTPQVPNEAGTKYVLPSFASTPGQRTGGKAKGNKATKTFATPLRNPRPDETEEPLPDIAEVRGRLDEGDLKGFSDGELEDIAAMYERAQAHVAAGTQDALEPEEEELLAKARRELLERQGQQTLPVDEVATKYGGVVESPTPTDANRESRYAGDNAAELLNAAEEEQRQRLEAIRFLEESLRIKPAQPANEKQLAAIKAEYEGAYGEISDAVSYQESARLRARVEARNVEDEPSHESGTAAVERPVAGGRSARPRDAEQPAGGDRTARPEGVAGEQPAPAEGVLPKPDKPARARKPRPSKSRGAAGSGTEAAGGGLDVRAGAGVDAPSHVDTADEVEDDAVADAHARGEAPRWFTVGTAEDLTEGGWTRKLDDNLAALRLLKTLQAAARPASDAEQAILARYIGWGHTELAPIVDVRGNERLHDPRKLQARQELDTLLTKDELRELSESTANAHYSFAELPRAMWTLVQHLGFKGGAILEPAIGTGHFLGTMPGAIRTARKTRVYGVDKEPIAAAIAAQLYQGAYIQNSPLEDAALPENYFDLIISNVPFGKIGVFDPTFVSAEKTPLTKNIHNYYFAKAVDLARPGGLLVFVTSRYSLDSRTDVARRYLAQRADFVGGFRLPDQAFRKTAGTDVVTDVLIFRKRDAGAKPAGEAEWIKVVDRKDLGAAYDQRTGSQTLVQTNEYYVAHPERVLGIEDRSGKMNHAANQYNVTGTVSPERLAAVVASFPANTYKPSRAPARKVAAPAQKDSRQGSFVVEHGKLFIFDKGTLTPSPLKGLGLARAKTFVPLRDAYQAVIDAMVANAADTDLLQAQKRLGQTYGAFVKQFGHVNKAENRRVIDDDPNASRVLALENIDVIKGAKGKPSTIIVTGLADIFTKRLMKPPQEPTTAASAQDALIQSVAWKGDVDIAYMESLTGKPAAVLAEDLAGEMFLDPATRAYAAREAYLSGDVVTKLAQAKVAANADPAFAGHVAELEKVQPTTITIDDFTGEQARSAPFGATWVPIPLIERFLKENGGGQDVSVRLLNSASKVTWYVDGWGRHEFLQSGFEFAKWVQEALNDELPTLYVRNPDGSRSVDIAGTERYRQSLGQLKEQWATWWKGDVDASTQLVDLYNALFNRTRDRKFDGSRLILPNSNPEVVLRAGQKDSVVGALQRGNTLLAQAVGWGKTYEMIAIVMEWRRLGLANKPMIVVPNHIVEQWRRDILKFYPAARVLLPEKRDFDTANRKRLIARIANNEWDAVVIGQSQFLRIGMNLQTVKAYIQEQEDQLLMEGAAEMSMTVEAFSEAVADLGKEGGPQKGNPLTGRSAPRSVKDVARTILNLRKRLKKRTDQQAKDPINFEELGVDALAVDEAHNFKNLYFYSGKDDIVGLKGSDADQALDMFLKVRHINQASNDRNVLFATGTPIANTMSELYTMFRYLAQGTLNRLGMAGFDAWANAYVQARGKPEPAPEGGYKERRRLTEWTNLRELSSLFKQFADVITTEDIRKENARLEAEGKPPLLKLPAVKKVTIELEPHPEAPAFYDDLRGRIEAIKKGKPGVIGTNAKTGEPVYDNYLTVTTSAGHAAVDMRLVRPNAEDDPRGRLRVAAREIAKRYTDSDAIKGTQIVFLDVGVAKGKDLPPLPASIAGGPHLEEAADDADAPDVADGLVDDEAQAEAESDALASLAIGKNLYGELKRLLVEKGIKPDEVAFIHQATNASEQHRLFQAVKDGRVRVLLSTRAKGGTGMNVQDRVVALHHLDVPWRPDQMEQSEGRAVRQGNINDTVEILRYVTKKSFDEYRWYVLAEKQGFISRFYRGEITNGEDIDPTQLDMQVASALASGDPRGMQMIQLERQLVGLRARYENFSRRRGQAERDKRSAESVVRDYDPQVAELQTVAAEARAWKAAGRPVAVDKKPSSGYSYGGFTATPPHTFSLADADSRKALREKLAPLLRVEHIHDTPIAQAGPFTISRDTVATEQRAENVGGKITIHAGHDAGVLKVTLSYGTGRDKQTKVLGSSPEWNEETPPDLTRSLDAKLDPDWPDWWLGKIQDGLDRARKEIAAADVILTKKFEQHEELAQKAAELRQLRIDLGIDKATAAATPATENTDDAEPDDAEAMEVEEPRARGPRGPIAQATLVPGLGQFTERDVVPALKTATKDVTEAHSAIRALWAPARVSESAETMAAIMRPNLALRRQRDAMARKNMRKLEVAWDRMPRAAQLAFAMAVDEGAVDTLPASQQELAKLLNSINSHKRHEANALGGKVGYIEHYFPREWVKPGKVREFVMRALYGKRPLQGRAGFKKARARDKETGDVFSFRTLHKAGFEPVSYNPITAHLRKWTEMDKWIAARRILLEAKQYGVATFVRVGDKPPEGETRYPESFGTVYGPPTIEVKEAYDAGLMEALHRFATEQGITTVRRLNLGGKKWGYHVRKGNRSEVHTRFGGPEGVLMHEIGHALDASHGLGEKIGLAQSSERREEINFAETPSKVIKELRALADLRLEKGSSKHFRQYVRNRAEVIANLVHAFLYAPDLARQVAPNAYWALYNLAKDTPDLRGLLDIQKARSLRVGVNTAVARIDGKVIKGYYYGPQDAVRLLDNYLSPGLRGNFAYDLYRSAGNFLNQVQLGLSVFHVLTTATNSTISRGALALEQASRGQVGSALKNAAITATLVGPPILDVIRGHRYLKAFYAKDAQFRELVHEADIIAKGGGGVGWDTFWHSSAPEQFLQAIRGTVAEAKAGNYPGALVRAGYAGWRTIPAALELLAKPVMEWWVPRLKLSAFLDLARMELRDLGPRPDPLEAAKVLGKAWDSVDNRFGELIYDNIFWHGILKDAGMASVRALGWNLGTVREVFGAIPAQAAQFGLLPGAGGGGGIGKPPQRLRNTGFTPDPDGGADIPVYERGRAPWLTHQFAYFMALLYVGAVMGAIYQYLHTGKRPGETDDGSTDPSLLLLDLYFPRTGAFKKDGRPERATLWTYMKDVFAFMRHPLDTAAGKLHPALSLAIDILRNEDYFGNAMRNGDDPFIQQATDIFTFIGQQYQPISVKNFAERKAEKGESGIGPFESFLGINVAPQKVTRTAAEDYLRSIAPATHRTKEEAVKAEARRDLRAARQDGDGEAARAAVTAGNLSRRSILLSAHSARQTALQRTFQSTTLAQAIHAYELATPEERAELRVPIARKWHSLFKDIAPDTKASMNERFKAAMKLPVARLGVSARPAAAATR